MHDGPGVRPMAEVVTCALSDQGVARRCSFICAGRGVLPQGAANEQGAVSRMRNAR